MSGWWIADLLHENPAMLVSWIVWVIGSIVLHELAHGWAALREGDTTPRDLGHMTWNPLVHMGGMSLLVFALVGIAWGQMPVNPSRFRTRYADAKVALAGPLMNVSLAIIAVVLLGIWIDLLSGLPEGLWTRGIVFLETGAMLNVVLALFNLVPVPPLDGSKILADLSSGYRRLLGEPRFAMVGMLIFVLIFFNASHLIFLPARRIVNQGVDVMLGVIPGDGLSRASHPSGDANLERLADWLLENFTDEELIEVLGMTGDQLDRLARRQLTEEELAEILGRLNRDGSIEGSGTPGP